MFDQNYQIKQKESIMITPSAKPGFNIQQYRDKFNFNYTSMVRNYIIVLTLRYFILSILERRTH